MLALGAVTALVGLYAQRGYVRAAAAPPVEGTHRTLQIAPGVLFLNPKSGGGKVEEFDLVAEAHRRGVETVVLGPDDDLTALAERAATDGAEVLGMAGGDGSQADVAAVAVAHGLPFVCIPAGTRNHFALDLNLDRSDPRPALDAFVEGIERRVDHGRAGDRFFVNNVSLGVYPYIVQDPSYRDGRLRATTDLLPELLDPERTPVDLRFTSPSGVRYETAQVVLVSNNPYRSGVSLDGAGRRVSLDGGVLGVLVVAASDPAGLATAMRNLALGAGIDAIDGPRPVERAHAAGGLGRADHPGRGGRRGHGAALAARHHRGAASGSGSSCRWAPPSPRRPPSRCCRPRPWATCSAWPAASTLGPFGDDQ